MKNLNSLKNFGKVLLLPIGLFVFAEIICIAFFHTHMFANILDVNNFFRSIGISVIASFALSINMSSGRMDLSLGGQQLIGCIIGGNLAMSLGFGPIGVLLTCVVFGALAGLIVGIAFVTLRLPSFVLGIGMALIFESISAAYSPGGFQLFGQTRLALLSDTWFIFIIAVVVTVAMYFLLTYSSFGLRYNAIRGAQRVAMNSGINITGNCLVCFTLCGGLIALAGVLDTGYTGYMQTALNMSSTTTAFTGFMPVFMAMFLQGYCPLTIGIPISVVTFKFLNMLLMKFNLPSAATTAITMSMLLVMLIVMGMINRSSLNKRYKLREELA